MFQYEYPATVCRTALARPAGERDGVIPVSADASGINPMKLIIQIPCFNEEQQLPLTLSHLPREVAGVDDRRMADHRRRFDRPDGRGGP